MESSDRQSASGHPDALALADALWVGVRHTPPIPEASGGVRGWYLSGPYATVVDRRRGRLWRHRSPEPWLTVQWLLDRSATPRSTLRFEGFPGQHSYEDAYQRVVAGEFTAPFLFVAGYSRSATTSVQNLVLAAFGDHVPPGSWDAPGHPLRLWWYPKHNPAVARQIADLDPQLARVIVCMRPFLDCAASLALYRGFTDPDHVTGPWVAEQMADWRRMAEVARRPHVITFPVDLLASISPAEAADLLAARLGVPTDARLDPETSWDELYAGRISPEELGNPFLSNLPHAVRPELTARLHERIADLVDAGPGINPLEDAYLAAVSA